MPVSKSSLKIGVCAIMQDLRRSTIRPRSPIEVAVYGSLFSSLSARPNLPFESFYLVLRMLPNAIKAKGIAENAVAGSGTDVSPKLRFKPASDPPPPRKAVFHSTKSSKSTTLSPLRSPSSRKNGSPKVQTDSLEIVLDIDDVIAVCVAEDALWRSERHAGNDANIVDRKCSLVSVR